MHRNINISDHQNSTLKSAEILNFQYPQSADYQYSFSCKNLSYFTGKECDEETGYGFFGARYMDHELMTMWLSIDPLADKYPSISPYAYCAWNPVRLVDPDGNEEGIPPLNNMLGRTIGEQNPNCPMNELAGKVLESFYKTGLYTGSLNEDGSWSVSRTKITDEQYDSYLNVLGGLDFNGFNSIEQANYRAKCERVNQTIQETGRWIDNK